MWSQILRTAVRQRPLALGIGALGCAWGCQAALTTSAAAPPHHLAKDDGAAHPPSQRNGGKTAAPLTGTHAHGSNWNAETAAAIAAVSSRQEYTGDIRHDMEALVFRIQDEICNEISRLDGTPFHEDKWERPEGGGGRSRVLQNGHIFEKAGVNVSVVSGHLPKAAATQMLERKRSAFAGEGPFPFYATGVSLVLHPRNPMAPTSHANYRLFMVTGFNEQTGAPEPMWWFGGGADLTPSYLFEEDATHFHSTLKAACDAHDAAYYPRFKRWADEYYLIKHRGETRGVGGTFFDDFSGPEGNTDPYAVFPFMVSAAESFLPAYVPIVAKRHAQHFSEEQKHWQQLRRGRYTEYNLVYDRGTRFGLNTPGSRVESILMSLPLTARWEYCHSPAPGSAEAALLEVLRKPKDWVVQ